MSKPLPEWCSTVGDPNVPWPGRCGVPTILASVPGIRAELFHRCSLKAGHGSAKTEGLDAFGGMAAGCAGVIGMVVAALAGQDGEFQRVGGPEPTRWTCDSSPPRTAICSGRSPRAASVTISTIG